MAKPITKSEEASTRRVELRLPAHLARKLNVVAAGRDMSISEVAAESLSRTLSDFSGEVSAVLAG